MMPAGWEFEDKVDSDSTVNSPGENDSDSPAESDRLDDIFSLPEPDANASVDEPDASLLSKPRRKPNSVKYQRKADKVLGFTTRLALAHKSTVPDGAALLMYGPAVAESFGDLAASNETIARAIDLLETGTDSPVLAAIAAVTPLIAQVARNHETAIQPKVRTIPVPFTKRTVTLKRPIGVKLGLFRNTAHDPAALAYHVLSNPDIQRALKRNGVGVAAFTAE